MEYLTFVLSISLCIASREYINWRMSGYRRLDDYLKDNTNIATYLFTYIGIGTFYGLLALLFGLFIYGGGQLIKYLW